MSYKIFSSANILCILLVYLLQNVKVKANPNGRIISLPQGRIKGRLSETRGGNFFMEYMGIPYCNYAGRFKSCRWPPKKWSCGAHDKGEGGCEDMHDGTHRPSPCFQMKGQMAIGEEECLTLNVATPANHNNYFILKDLPVMVIFHGGSWSVDRGDWNGGEGDQLGPKHMMDEFVIVVTVNYRLGVLGFFSTFNADGPSNLGLKDQVMALRWVKEYISYFGGNASSVTIVGQGSGAAAVGLHLLSPMSKGLFHKAIMQSGSPLCHWALNDDITGTGFTKYMSEVGCGDVAFDDGDKINAKDAVACLEKKDLKDLEQARQKLMGVTDDPFYLFTPVVEHWVRTVPRLKVFLPDYPHNILLNATNDTWGGIPIMMGVNSQDGLNFVTGQYIYNPAMKDMYFGNYTKSYPPNFGYGLSRNLPKASSESQQDDVTNQIRQFYYENVQVEDMSGKSYHQTHVDMYSHRNYFQCVKNAAVLYGKLSDMYLYYWSRNATSFKKWHDYDKLNLTRGVANGDEAHFLYDNADDFGDFSMIRLARPKHLNFSRNLVRLWVRFAAHGKQAEDWKNMKGQGKSGLQWYQLGDERMMMSEPFTRYTDFWDSLGLDEPRPLPPPGDMKKKQLGRKERPEGERAGGEGFIYVDLPADQDGT